MSQNKKIGIAIIHSKASASIENANRFITHPAFTVLYIGSDLEDFISLRNFSGIDLVIFSTHLEKDHISFVVGYISQFKKMNYAIFCDTTPDIDSIKEYFSSGIYNLINIPMDYSSFQAFTSAVRNKTIHLSPNILKKIVFDLKNQFSPDHRSF